MLLKITTIETQKINSQELTSIKSAFSLYSYYY